VLLPSLYAIFHVLAMSAFTRIKFILQPQVTMKFIPIIRHNNREMAYGSVVLNASRCRGLLVPRIGTIASMKS
jgi:hypothetical protein